MVSPADPEVVKADDVDAAEVDAAEEAARLRRLVAWGKATAHATQAKAQGHLEAHRHRAPVDLAIRVYERDRDAAGSLLGSAVAFRLFLFFVPMLLALVGLAGFVSNIGEADPEDAGITGNLAQHINTALTQPNSTRWIATILGLFGMLSAGRTLSKVLNAASCMAWAMPVRAKASVERSARPSGSSLASRSWRPSSRGSGNGSVSAWPASRSSPPSRSTRSPVAAVPVAARKTSDPGSSSPARC